MGQIRCSRNDGKNWRCSEMAVPGHKHCPKHMRWSAGSRNAAASKQQGANGGVKRPRWMPDPGAKDVHSGGMPFGAQNPFLASPLLSAAASALDELHQKENMMRALGGMMPAAFGFGRWPASCRQHQHLARERSHRRRQRHRSHLKIYILPPQQQQRSLRWAHLLLHLLLLQLLRWLPLVLAWLDRCHQA